MTAASGHSPLLPSTKPFGDDKDESGSALEGGEDIWMGSSDWEAEDVIPTDSLIGINIASDHLTIKLSNFI